MRVIQCALLLSACAPLTSCGAPRATNPHADSPEPIDLTRSGESQDPFSGLIPCTDDDVACGATSEKASRAPTSMQLPPAGHWSVPVEPDDPSRGSTDALVTVIVFSDFECPFCKMASATLDELYERHPRDVRLVWKNLPLPMHANAEEAAEFGLAVFAQAGNRGFWLAHDALFAAQSDLNEKTFEEIAERIDGVDWSRAVSEIRSKVYGPLLIADEQLADAVAVAVTPTTFVNGRKIAGAQPLSTFEQAVTEELQKAQQLIDAGTARKDVYARIVATGTRLSPPSDLPSP